MKLSLRRCGGKYVFHCWHFEPYTVRVKPDGCEKACQEMHVKRCCRCPEERLVHLSYGGYE